VIAQLLAPPVPARARRDPAARAAAGRAARTRAPLDSHAELPTAPDRPDPVAVLTAQEATRVPELIPIRHGRMLLSPFTFLRGAAAVMAADLAVTPTSGLVTQLCGDAHLSNFGAFASPERRLMFDVNDFDETHPGPWEWDVKRLAASLSVAGRDNGFGRKARADIVRTAVGRYRQAMSQFAGMRDLDVWYARADLDELGPQLAVQLDKARRKRWTKAQARARTHDSLQAMGKLTSVVDGHRRIIGDPPLVVPLEQALPNADRDRIEVEIRRLLAGYRRTLQPDRRHLLGGYEFVDMARKVVGVGSVGTRAFIALLQGRDAHDPLFLQVKEATASVLEPYVGKSRYKQHGERVVQGQRMMQAASDIYLGWTVGLDVRRNFYWRQLRDMKGSALVEAMVPLGLTYYAQICGWTLARAHARSGDPVAIAEYLGETDAFDRSITGFSERYADQNERDYEEFVKAVSSGRLEAVEGV